MSRKLAIAVAAGSLAALAAVLLTVAPARADRPFGLWSLDGTYDFTWLEMRYESGGLDYCTGWGYAVFDGAGNAAMTGTRRCSQSGTVTESWEHVYTVDAHGGVTLQEVGTPWWTHGLLVDKGRMLITDATTVNNPDILIHHAVAVKR